MIVDALGVIGGWRLLLIGLEIGRWREVVRRGEIGFARGWGWGSWSAVDSWVAELRCEMAVAAAAVAGLVGFEGAVGDTALPRQRNLPMATVQGSGRH